MVVEAKETMTRFFDTMNEGFRNSLDATRRAQESFFKVATDTTKTNPSIPGFDAFFTTGERFAKEFTPFVNRSFETFVQTVDAGVRTNVDAFRTVCDMAGRTEDTDVYKKTRKVWDVMFDAARTNFDAFGKTGTRAMENCSAFCQAVYGEDVSAKTTGRAAKVNA
jgi:hypothetical protein